MGETQRLYSHQFLIQGMFVFYCGSLLGRSAAKWTSLALIQVQYLYFLYEIDHIAQINRTFLARAGKIQSIFKRQGIFRRFKPREAGRI